MPLDHSIEARQDYDRSRRTSAYPPSDLQIPSFRAVARKAVHRTLYSIHSIRGEKKKKKQPSHSPASQTQPHAHNHNNHNDNDHRKASTHPQFQSVFFALPAELRHEIYSQVLGDSNIHVHFRGRSLRHHRCKCASCPGIAHFHEYNRAWKRTWACGGSKYTYDGDRVSVGILWTCRRIYEEAVGYLYRENIFSFKGFLGLWGFLGPYRNAEASGIREVHLDLPLRSKWDGGEDEDLGAAGDAWDMMASLECLRVLEVRVHPLRTPSIIESEHELNTVRDVVLHGPGSCYGDSLDRLSGRLEKFREAKAVQVVRVYVPRGMLEHCRWWLAGEPFEVRAMDEWSWYGTTTTVRRIPLEVF